MRKLPHPPKEENWGHPQTPGPAAHFASGIGCGAFMPGKAIASPRHTPWSWISDRREVAPVVVPARSCFLRTSVLSSDARRRMVMTKRTSEESDTDERLAEAQARIESLEAAAADAEARGATALEELTGAREARSNLEAQLEEAVAAWETAEGELARTRSEAAETRMGLAEAAVKYRGAKLAAAPEIPQELVPAAESLAENGEGCEAALRVHPQLRSCVGGCGLDGSVPAGRHSRRTDD